MAINRNYTRPQHEVFQLVDATVASTGDHLGALVVGTQYDLYRYGHEELTPHTFKAAGDSIAYEIDRADLYDYQPDLKSAQLYGENLLAKVADIATSTIKIKPEPTNYMAIRLANPSSGTAKLLASTSVDDKANLIASNGYSLQIGDIVRDTTTGKQGRVVQLLGVVTADGITSSTQFDGAVLDSCIFDLTKTGDARNLSSVAACKSFSGIINSTATAASISYDAGAGITGIITAIDGTAITAPFINEVGSIYAEYRVAVIPTADEAIQTLTTTAEIQAAYGTIDPANELAYAAQCALDGTVESRAIMGIRVRQDNAEGFLEAMHKTESNTRIYSVVPVTSNVEAIQAVVKFNAEQSAPEVKHWRMTLVGVDAVGEYVVAEKTSTGANILANIVEYYEGEISSTGHATLVMLTDTTAANFSFTNLDVNGVSASLHAGDKICVAGNDYTIKEVISGSLVRLVANEGPATVTTAATITCKKADTSANNVEYAGNLAQSIGTRRAVVVWCDHGTKNGKLISNAYLAAEIAGLQSVILPQQPITHTQIVSITAAPRMYTRYTQAQLDDIAAQGVLIITQDDEEVTPYIRHQLTTVPDKGILYSEMSCTRNLDNISYHVCDILDPKIGKTNVTPSALRQIRTEVTNMLLGFTQDSVDDLIGPSVVEFDNVSINQDKQFADRVIVRYRVHLPAPLNNIKTYEQAIVAFVTID